MIIQHIIFFGVLFSLLLGIQQFLKIESSLNKWTGILFLCLSWGLLRAFFQNDIQSTDTQMIIPILSSVVIAAIALQAYFRIILQDEGFGKSYIYRTIISITIIIDILLIIFISAIKQSGNWKIVIAIIHFSGGAFLVGSLLRYLIPQFFILLKSRFSFAVFYTFSICTIILVLIVFGLIGTGFNSMFATNIYSVGFTVLLIIVFLLSKIHPEILSTLGQEVINARYLKSSLTAVDKSELKSKLDYLMENEKLFQDEECCLNNVASELNLTTHQLSEFLNKDLNTSFSNFINSYRIKMVVKLLQESQEKTILEAAFEAGFGNKSSFNEAFRRETGMTPREYRKKSKEL